MTDNTKLPLTSENPSEALLTQLRELAPQVFTEGKVDLDKLKATLGESIESKAERYGLNWAGKSDAFRVLQQPSVGTLLPMPEESVNFDTSENLIIEGDNLEVLKLLQKSYYGKVKMIYIDPPYNTGNEFIYPDNYREGLDDYLKYSGQITEEGQRKSSDTETSGRYHSKWLNMMYPRLFLARNLLREDGVIFASIDDNEVHNLRMVMNEIFGEEQFIGQIVWKNVTDNNPTNITTEHEYIVCYAWSKDSIAESWKSSVSDVKDKLIEIGRSLNAVHADSTELQVAYSSWFRENKAFLAPMDRYKYIDQGGVYIGSQSVHNPGREGYRYDVIHPVTQKPCKQPLMGYRFPKETMDKLLQEDRIIFGENHNKIIELKVYAKDYQDKLSSVIQLDGRLGSYELKELFPEVTKIFDNPKSIELMRLLLQFVLEANDIVLDFFAGSGTTAHSILDLNRKDRGNRKFILIQLPEKTENPALSTIAHITRERVRRVIKKLNIESPNANQDRGFRAFKLSSSNFKIWDARQAPEDAENLAEQLQLYANNVEHARTQQDILYELMLKSGMPLTAKVETKAVAGLPVYSIEDRQLLVCLAETVNQDVLRGMMALEPTQILCLDAAFHGNDQLKTNAVLEAQSHGITFRTV